MKVDVLRKKSEKKNQIEEIDVDGFKIRLKDLTKNNIIPEYFNAPLLILWELTRECNLKCIQCYNNSYKKYAIHCC